MSKHLEQVSDVTIHLNEVQDAYLDRLVELGVFGMTRASVVARILDRAFLELIREEIIAERKP